jgi:hypothetical protein
MLLAARSPRETPAAVRLRSCGVVKRLSRLLVLVLTALAVVLPAAAAPITVGVNDDAAKDSRLTPFFFPAMGAGGLQDDAITLRWDETSPTAVPDEAAVDRAIELAAGDGVTVELDLFPLHSQAFTGGAKCAPSPDPESCGDADRIQQFAAWTGAVARAFPSVHQFVVMNECNQPLFVNPQYDQAGQDQSAEICGRALVAAYDVLKAASPANTVWGVGLSPRGNDNPNATSNVSISPVRFLRDLGAWYRAYVAKTARTRPLMDGLDFHPYPIPQSQPFAQGYQNANDASVSNLPRIYQAFYDGFNGTPQRTIGQQPGGGLPLSLNEVGVQTDSTGRTGYVGTEVSANSAGGVLGSFATEAFQAGWYEQMLNLLACDPNVRVVNIYHLVDEAGLGGWQSGLYYVDGTAKASAAVVHDWIAGTGGLCQGQQHPWTPAGVPAAPATPPAAAPPSKQRIVAAADGRIRIFDAVTHALRRVLAPFGTAYTGPLAVALGDVNRDGVRDIAVAQGAGGAPVVRILNGKSGAQMASISPFPASFRGGVTVALGDVDGDGRADLVAGTGPGTAAAVKVVNVFTRATIATIAPFGPAYRGGVAVAAGDVNGDRRADIVVGTGGGTAGRIRIFDGRTSGVVSSLIPFGPSYRGPVSVAAADLNADGKADVVAATGSGAPASVRAYRSGASTSLVSLAPFAAAVAGGAAVGAADLDGDRKAEVVVGAGSGGGSQVKVYDAVTRSVRLSFLGAPGSSPVSVAAG